ncbi:transposase [Micromonospora sp. NPDC000663]|uniref:transposase n=1 Tax=Micromonospora sp. NPDC000663 TaxID=3364218 RepID=UPI0036C8C097
MIDSPSMDLQRGGRWRDHRQVINGIVWRTENGANWHQVPDRYGPLEDGAVSGSDCRPTRTPPVTWTGGPRPT